MRVSNEFFKDLCEVAKKHGAVQVGTVTYGDDDVVLIAGPNDRFDCWQQQNSLEVFGYRRNRISEEL